MRHVTAIPLVWEMGWLDKIRQAIGLPVSQAELLRRLDHINAGGGWPPVLSINWTPPRPPPPPQKAK